jgi:hypothetical protein
MANNPLPDPDFLRKLLDYDPETGILLWKIRTPEIVGSESERRRWNARHAGKPAVTYSDKKGYCRGHIGGQMLYAHRIAWAITYGYWPPGFIDHINGDRADNRISNLRVVDKAGNMRNQRPRPGSISGVHGVIWNRKHSRWYARISVDAKPIHLGSFENKEDAIAARKAAETKYGYHPNHGRMLTTQANTRNI